MRRSFYWPTPTSHLLRVGDSGCWHRLMARWLGSLQWVSGSPQQSEWLATRGHWVQQWAYAPAMPVMPGTGARLAPLLRWMVVPLLTLWFVRRAVGEHVQRESAGGAQSAGAPVGRASPAHLSKLGGNGFHTQAPRYGGRWGRHSLCSFLVETDRRLHRWNTERAACGHRVCPAFTGDPGCPEVQFAGGAAGICLVETGQ